MRIPLPVARKKARIEIIPLIDIVFFLLATFVMVSMSMVKNQGILVKFPSVQTGTPQERRVSVTVGVAEDGGVYLDKEKISRSQLAGKLKQLLSTSTDLSISIHGDEKAAFGDAVGVLDEVRRLGIKKVSIQTRGKNS